MFPFEIDALARLLIDEARTRGVRIVTAESCTGGLVAAAITAIPGSSDVFDRSFITYSNRAKEEMLGVPGDLIADVGAVSESVSRIMAEAALTDSNAHLSIAITGIAGPGGGTPMKPVGTVHFATARSNGAIHHRMEVFDEDDRDGVRMNAVRVALEMLRERVN
jgi:nicotinamide-nucleotide amidase